MKPCKNCGKEIIDRGRFYCLCCRPEMKRKQNKKYVGKHYAPPDYHIGEWKRYHDWMVRKGHQDNMDLGCSRNCKTTIYYEDTNVKRDKRKR